MPGYFSTAVLLMHMRVCVVQALQADLAILRRKERSARVEVAQLRAKLTALDDFAGDQFEASLCATPSRLTCGMSVHGDESSMAGVRPLLHLIPSRDRGSP